MKKILTVKTYSGKITNKTKCRKIAGIYYEKEVDCFFMSDKKWHRINNGLILKVTNDLKTFEYIFKAKSSNYTECIIGIDKNYDLIIEHVHYDLIEAIKGNYNLIHYKSKNYVVLNNKLQNRIAIYLPSHGHYALLKDLLNVKLKKTEVNHKLKELLNEDNILHKYAYFKNLFRHDDLFRFNANYTSLEKVTNPMLNSLAYNIASYNINQKDRYKFSEEELRYNLSNKDFLYAKMLGKSTFGIEIESASGKIPMNILHKHSFVPLRDGSISGYEFTSDVLQGASGIASIKGLSKWFKLALTKSTNESFHVHIKSDPITKEFITNLYSILYKLQDEIFEMFPGFIKKTSVFKHNGKDYNKPLINLEATLGTKNFFKKIYKYYLTNNFNMDDVFTGFEKNVTPHPLDSSSNRKWNINTRYHFCNFIPALFNKSGTIEFRLHPNTFDYEKIIYWILIVNAIVKYAHRIKYTSNSPLDLKTIISAIYYEHEYMEITSELIKYISNRKNFYKKTQDIYSKKSVNFIKTTNITNDSLKRFINEIRDSLLDIESGEFEIRNDSIDAFI